LPHIQTQGALDALLYIAIDMNRLFCSVTGSALVSAASNWAWYVASACPCASDSYLAIDWPLRLRNRRPGTEVSPAFAVTCALLKSRRDDPSVDENTRLRNRIAELESLVRELRGKPHPRWADNNLKDADPNEKWHSRATKCAPLSTKRSSGDESDPSTRTTRGGLLSPIKTEPPTEGSNPSLYRFSPSPAPSVRYHPFDVRRTSSTGSFDNEQSRQQQSQQQPQQYSPTGISLSYPASPNHHHHHPHFNGNSSSSYPEASTGSYPIANSDDGSNYSDQFPSNGSGPQNYCPCRNSPSLGVASLGLSQQLREYMSSLRQFNHQSSCMIYRRVVELHDLLQ